MIVRSNFMFSRPKPFHAFFLSLLFASQGASANPGTVSIPVGSNTESVSGRTLTSGEGFAITIDDGGNAQGLSSEQRAADIQASQLGIQIRFDGLGANPQLNIQTTKQRTAFGAGETVSFRTYSNYPAYFSRAEIRILDRKSRFGPAFSVIPASANGIVSS